MPPANPYAPPSAGAQLCAPARRATLVEPTDPGSVRRAHLWAERQVRGIAGMGYVFGLAILAWSFAVLTKSSWAGLVAALILFALGATTVAGAYWLSRLEPSGRWCATGLSALLAIILAPAAWTAALFEPRAALAIGVGIGVVVVGYLAAFGIHV